MREVTANARGGNYIYRYEYGPSGYILEGGLFSNDRVRDVENNWKRVWGVFTTNVNTTNIQLYSFNYVYNTPIEIQMVGYQIEAKPHPTRYVTQINGVRSNTQALLDLSPKRRTITLTSMTYAADDAISFTGSVPNLLTFADPEIGSYNWTVEFVFRTTSSSFQYLAVPQNAGIDQQFRYNADGSLTLQLAVAGDTGERSVGPTPAGVAPVNQWNHVVFQRTNNNVFIWSNGIKYTFTDTTSNAPFGGGSNWAVGQRGNGQSPFTGEIPIVRIYSRILTDEEVKGNWHATRRRFGI
jgi:hypothetical protein